MQSQLKYEQLSDQDLVENIQSHSGSNSTNRSPKDLYLLKLEYSRRAREAKTIAPHKLVLLCLAQGGLVSMQLMSRGKNGSAPLLGEFIWPKFFIVAGVLSIVVYLIWTTLIASTLKARRGKRPESRNGFRIVDSDSPMKLTKHEADELMRFTNKTTEPAQYLLLKQEVSAAFAAPGKTPSKQSGFRPQLLPSHTGNFANESDYELLEMLKRVSPQSDPALYGLIKLEFERRNPKLTFKESFGYFALSTALAGAACFATSIYSSSKIGIIHILGLGIVSTISIFVIMQKFMSWQKKLSEGKRNANPMGFYLDPKDPIYEFTSKEFDLVKKELYLSESLTPDDHKSLKGRQDKLVVAVMFIVILAIGIWVSFFIK